MDRRQLLALGGAGPASAWRPDPRAPRRRRDFVANPRVDQMVRPLGLENLSPRFSWTLEGGARNAVQSAYRIRVASSREALLASGPLLWDSGKVASNASFDIAYRGPPLASRQRCWWRVEAWDGAGKAIRASASAWWEMGLLEASDWSAGWLEAETEAMRAERLEGVPWVWGSTADNAKPRSLPLALRPADGRDGRLGDGVGQGPPGGAVAGRRIR
ncbi:hypothetical protein ACRAWD_29505 [Caulobacter segnis]